MLNAALMYAEKGYSVIPVQHNKKPYVKWTKFQTEKAAPQQIRQWWKDHPEANIGIVTGEISGLTVLDPDTQAGIDALNDLIPENFTTPIANTPHGGQHYYFQYVAGLPNKSRCMLDTDIRNDGGYIVAAPGSNGSGKYQWSEGLSLNEISQAKMPENLRRTIASSSEHINKGTIDSSLYRGEKTPPVIKVSSGVINVIKFDRGQRDESIFHVANCLIKGGMTDANTLEC